MSIAEDLIAEFKARIEAALAATEATVRRDHLTPLDRDATPMVDIVTGDDVPDAAARSCFTTRRLNVGVDVHVRSDASYAAADPYLVAIMAAVAPEPTAYPHNAGLEHGRIRRPRPEIADSDALTVTMEFAFTYRARAWTLDEAA